MELHAFERMAQNAEDALYYRQADDCGETLLPQPMTAFPEDTPPGMAYVPYQMWGDVYDADTALCKGTAFPVLDKPFSGMRGGDGR